MLGRLAAGADVDRANSELDALAARLRSEHPEHAGSGLGLRAVPLDEEVVAHVHPFLVILVGTAAIVLVVACANLAVLRLVRFVSRRRGTAQRAALGADRVRLVIGLLEEAALVCMTGALLGLAIAGPAVQAIIAMDPGIVPRADQMRPDALAVGAAVVIGGVATILSGLGPALITTFDRIGGLLRSRRSSRSRTVVWTRRGLLVIQVAASVILLYGGSTLLGSVVEVRSADLGFDGDGVRTARVTLPFGSYREPATWVSFFHRLRAGLSAHPEVASVGLTSDLPAGGAGTLEPWAPVDAPPSETWGARTALHHVVSPGYFGAAGIDVREGRAIEATDGSMDLPVAVVDDALAVALTRDGGQVVGRDIHVTRHTFDGQRRRELGIRIALGARADQVVRVVLRSGLAVVASGILPGALITPWAGNALQNALGHGPKVDSAALGLALLAVVAIAGLACYLPARRAGRIHPMTVLKEE